MLEWVIVLDTLDSLLRLCFISVFLMKESCPGPLTVDIDTDMSELHLEPVTISPYTRGRRGHQHSTKGYEVMAKRERGNRKDSVRDPRGDHSGHQNKLSHHGTKGKQQRYCCKLTEKPRSNGMLSKMFCDSFTIQGEGPY